MFWTVEKFHNFCSFKVFSLFFFVFFSFLFFFFSWQTPPIMGFYLFSAHFVCYFSLRLYSNFTFSSTYSSLLFLGLPLNLFCQGFHEKSFHNSTLIRPCKTSNKCTTPPPPIKLFGCVHESQDRPRDINIYYSSFLTPSV